MALRSKHHDAEDQQGSEKHLDEQSLSDGCLAGDTGRHSERAEVEPIDHTCCCDSTSELSWEEQAASGPRDGANQTESQCHGRIELASADAEEDPASNGQ